MDLSLLTFLPWLAFGFAVLLLIVVFMLYRHQLQLNQRQQSIERQVRALQATTRGMGQAIVSQRAAPLEVASEPEIGLAEKHLMARLAEHKGLN